MKSLNGLTALGLFLLAAEAFGGEQQVLKTQKDKENYSAGVEFVQNLKQQGGAVDLDIVIQGIKDGLTGERLLMTEAEIRRTMAGRDKERQPDQAVNKHDTIEADVAGTEIKEIKDDAMVRQKEDPPEQHDVQFQPNMPFAKGNVPMEKNELTDAIGPPSMQASMSTDESNRYFSERQRRALEMRRRTQEQGRQ